MSALVSMMSACGGPPEAAAELGTATSALSAPSAPPAMIVYSPRGTVDESTLAPLGPPEELGGEVLEGSPKLYARVDFSSALGMTAGIFKATTGRVKIVFPFNEHATILEGAVTITDETGQSHTFKKGESYFIRKGQIVTWEVKGKHVIKSFLNIME